MPELKVQASACDSVPMVQSEDVRIQFVARLKQAMAAEGIPAWGMGTRLAKEAGVTAKAASKWLNAEAMPGRANMIAIADWLKVRVEWLAHGEGEIRSTGQAPQKQSELLAAGMALFNKVTPRSKALIEQISELDAQGKLTDDDIKALQQIIRRFGTSK